MRSEFLKASAARLFTVAATFASGMANLKLYGTFFTPDVYGVMIVAVQLVGYLPMLDGGFRMATNRRLLAAPQEAKPPLILFSQEVYSWLFLLCLTIGAAAMGVYAVRPHAGGIGSQPLLFPAMGVCGAFSVFAGAQAGLLLGLGAQAAMCVVAATSALLGVGALAAALYSGLGIWAFPVSIAGSALSNYILAYLFLRRTGQHIPPFRLTFSTEFRARFVEIGRDAWLAFRSQVAILLLFSSDLIVASFFCKPADVAIYGVVSRILSIVRSFLQIFNESAWPFVAARAHAMDRLQEGLVRANGWVYGLAGGGLIATLAWFVSWYMGAAWEPPAFLCWLFVVRFLVIGSSGPAAYYLLGQGDFHNYARCVERELLLSVAFSLALGPFFGIAGIAVGYLLGTAGGSLLPFWVIYAPLQNQKASKLFLGTWLRIAAGFAAGLLAGKYLLHVSSGILGRLGGA